MRQAGDMRQAGHMRQQRRKKLREGRNKLREFWVEGEVYRDWKRKKSTQLLLQQPQAQLAVEQLWQQLINKVQCTFY